jgi:hypothetical protein
MRFHLTWAVALALAFAVVPGYAADWNMQLLENTNGKRLTSLSIMRPFWVSLTNTTDHDQTLLSYTDRPFLQLGFIFAKGDGEDVTVGMGAYSETWNECGPKVVAPGKSFLIKVDFRSKVWLHTKELEGRMAVKAIYGNSMKFPFLKSASVQDQSPPPVWTGEMESEPIQITVER